MSRIKDFAKGLGFLTKGFSFLVGHPRLWVWAALPTFINLVLLGVMLAVFVHYYGDVYGWLSAHIGVLKIQDPSTWYWQALNVLLWVLNLLFQVLIVVVSLTILLIASYVLGLIIASPFNDLLSERVEIIAANYEPSPFSMGKFLRDTIRIIRVESVKASVLIVIPVVLFIFNFVPVVGGFLYVALMIVFGSWALGFSYADLPFGRRAAPFSERWLFAKNNRWALIGFGAGFVVPFFSLIFTAPMVVGGTLLFINSSRNSAVRKR